MKKTAVLNVVGLTRPLLARMTRLSFFAGTGAAAAIRPAFPAVTCTAQSSYLTGLWPGEHGVVGNGWYFRDENEVRFWRQSNRLVRGEKIWDRAKALDPAFTCANLFWWYNMYSTADISVTPRPMYPADGRKIPDVYTSPGNLREELTAALGPFPLFQFWGPATSINASRWIAKSARFVEEKYSPTLSLVYLPHLDYVLQQEGPSGPSVPQALAELDQLCGELLDFYRGRDTQVVILSEYGISPVSKPVHLNRILRENGLLKVREELGLEILDPGASAAFAVADHQVAHVYVNDLSRLSQVRSLLAATDGVGKVLDGQGKKEHHIDNARAGELVAVAAPGAWFTYYYWLDDAKAPDFARTVDIHRKPGYDPVELFFDPALTNPKLKAGLRLLQRTLGFRALMDVIPLDASLVKGSHGRIPEDESEWPLLVTGRGDLASGRTVESVEVADLILSHLLK